MSSRKVTPRLVKLGAFSLLVFAVSIAAMIWQIARLHQVRQFNAQVRAGLEQSPQPIGVVMTAAAEADPRSVRYRRATATGTFDAAHELVAYGRERRGLTGSDILTPLVLGNGRIVMVDRGWTTLTQIVPQDLAAPSGRVTVTGVLLPTEGGDPGALGSGAQAPVPVAKIDLRAIQAELPYRIEPVYLLLQQQVPAVSPAPAPEVLPPLSEGPHLSYAIQWSIFAATALVGFVILARSELRPTPAPTTTEASGGTVG